MYTVAVKYGWAHSLRVTPDGQLQYSYRPAPPDKKRGGSQVSIGSRREKTPAESGASAPASPVAALSVETNFTTGLKHSKIGRNGYGVMPSKPVRFTLRAKRSVRWGAAAVERQFGLDRCWFLTGTLPGSTSEAIVTLALWSSYLQDRVNKWLHDNYSIGGQCYRVSVWEGQKRGALHFHALVATEDESIIDAFKNKWVELLEQVSDATGVDLFARSNGKTWRGRYQDKTRDGKRILDVACDVQRVKKSVSAYLSKYLSKEAGQYYDRKPVVYPARWWSMSNAVRQLIAEQVIVYRFDRCSTEQIEPIQEMIRQLLEASFGLGKWAGMVRNLGRESEFRVGWCAWGEYNELLEYAKIIDETVNGYMNYAGITLGNKNERFNECYSELKRAKQIDDEERQYYAELAMQYATETKIALQLEQKRMGVHVDVALRNELRNQRRMLDGMRLL